jgi:AcrR family transcriptional regulator
MAHSFTIEQRHEIRERLISKGRILFMENGLSKTSVESITRETGIAKGSFYAFYTNKEELYFDILKIELDEKQQVIEQLVINQMPAHKAFIEIMEDAFQFIEENKLIRNLYEKNEFQQMLDRIPDDKRNWFQNDTGTYALSLFSSWQNMGIMKKEPPEILRGILNTVTVLSLNRNIIGVNFYKQFTAWLIDVLAEWFIPLNRNNTSNLF